MKEKSIEYFASDKFMKEEFVSSFNANYKESDLNEKNKKEFKLYKWFVHYLCTYDFDDCVLEDYTDALQPLAEEICGKSKENLGLILFNVLDELLIYFLDNQGD